MKSKNELRKPTSVSLFQKESHLHQNFPVHYSTLSQPLQRIHLFLAFFVPRWTVVNASLTRGEIRSALNSRCRNWCPWWILPECQKRPFLSSIVSFSHASVCRYLVLSVSCCHLSVSGTIFCQPDFFFCVRFSTCSRENRASLSCSTTKDFRFCFLAASSRCSKEVFAMKPH